VQELGGGFVAETGVGAGDYGGLSESSKSFGTGRVWEELAVEEVELGVLEVHYARDLDTGNNFERKKGLRRYADGRI
jgi:hypothetical protein